MSFPRYPEYKDSGVVWLGEVPVHWHALALKYVAREKGSLFIDGDWIESKDISGSGIRYITTGNVGEGTYKEQGAGFISEATFSALNCTEVLPGDVLISRLNLPIGRACVVPELGYRIVTSVDNVIVRADQCICRKFLVYALSSSEHFAATEILARGSTMQRISRTMLGNIRIYLPNREEQGAIAAFLDRETAKIDALVAEQEKLIALLKEKRQAVISHAVTKGLDPMVPMKDSGIEWLGEVPAHWAIAPIKHLGWLKGGAGFPHDEQGVEGEELDFHKVNALGQARPNGVLQSSENTISRDTAERLSAFVFPPRTIVFAKVGAALLLGRIRELASPACIDNNMMGLVVDEGRNDVTFVRQAMGLVRFDLIANPGAVPSLNESQIGNFALASPPLNEQVAIATYLDSETTKLDALTAEAERAIDLLKERRSALISAAVTGKIDVRGVVAEREAA